jgi:Bacterial transcriptional activator domain
LLTGLDLRPLARITAAHHARKPTEAAAAQFLDRPLALWRGRALADLDDPQFAWVEAARFEEACLCVDAMQRGQEPRQSPAKAARSAT